MSPAGVSRNFAKLGVLADWQLLTTVYNMQSLFFFVNFNGDLINKQTALTAFPYNLTAACKTTEQVHFSAESDERLNKNKRRLCAAARISYLNFEAPFMLDMDALKIVGAVLLNRNANGFERAISFFSIMLQLAQR